MIKRQGISTNPELVFCGSSVMAEEMRNYDWESSSLGPVESWSEPLKISVRNMLTSAYPMVLLWGEDFVLLYNDSYIPMLGPKHPNALGKSGKVKWAEIWDKIGQLLENVIKKGETTFGEKVLLLTERNCFKEETYYTFSYSPIFEKDGTVGGVFCVCYEETSQVLNERRLKTIGKIAGVRTDVSVSDSRAGVINAFSENPNDLPFVALYHINEGKAILSNYTQDAFLEGLEDKTGFPELDFILANAAHHNIKIIPVPAVLKEKLKVPAHGILPEQAAIVPVKDVGQNLIRGYLIIGISAILPYDDAYEKFLNLLSSQVNATVTNVRSFEQERLLSKKLIELDKAKTDFFHNVSHEFRTPLTLILGPLELLLNNSENLSEQDKTSLQLMQRNGLRLLKQVNNLLNFSYVEAGRYHVCYVPTDISRLTSDLASTFKTLMQQTGISYTIVNNQVTEPVFVDTEMWEMIVLNLLSNAYKFTLSGKVEIGLIEKTDVVELHVSDTGVGISQQDIAKVFERFYRIEQNVVRSIEGSGIGLSLVSELVKMHGGSIEVLSEVGKGSEFIVTIPKGYTHLPPDKIKFDTNNSTLSLEGKTQYQLEAESWLVPKLDDLNTPATKPETAKRGEGQNCSTVLLVDDNADMLEYVKRLIQDEYHVLTAGNGQEALNLMQHYIPDLILSDVMMPVMDGVALLKTLRNNPAFAAIPVILLSARAGEEDKFYGLNVGADDYLIKPFSARELVTRVNASIKNARLRNELKEKELQLLKEAKQRKELLESILSSISDGFFYVSPELEFIYVNNKALELGKRKREEHTGKKILEVYPYLAGTELYQKILEAAILMQPSNLEYYDEKLLKWFDCRLHPTASGTTAYFADITDRKLEEQARLETEKRFAEMANAAPILIWMSGTDMLCDFFNDKWLEFRGRTFEEEYGNGWVEGVHPDDVAACMEAYTSAFKAKQEFSIEYRLLNKHGVYRWILNNGVPRITANGQLLGFVSACTDITEFKWAESLLSKYNSELEEQVNARTSELQRANEQLHSLTSHLQDLRENDRKLIAREIHDELGQALTAFKIEILLLYDRIEDSRSKYKNVMLESIQSMEQALDASLISLRKIISQLRPSLTDDLELVYEIQRLVTDLEKRLGIPITVKSDVTIIELPPNIAIEVFRVMQESVTNIIKHARATAAYIEISKENDKFRFLVADNGVGFDENLQAGKRSFGILGIKERAQRIGADLIINSCKGKGTTVELLVDATLDKMN